MDTYISILLLGITSFFTLINPLGVMPIFMTLTSELEEQQRRATAKKAIIVSFVVLILFAVSGQLLFKFFGISVNSFKIVGGVIFFMMGMDMLQARLSRNEVKETDVKKYVTDISITPLAIPMICGPGAITNAIVLMEEMNTFIEQGILLISIMLVMVFTYLILLSSTKIIKTIGDTGNAVLMRLMGLIVMVIAVEFFFSGLKPIIGMD